MILNSISVHESQRVEEEEGASRDEKNTLVYHKAIHFSIYVTRIESALDMSKPFKNISILRKKASLRQEPGVVMRA